MRYCLLLLSLFLYAVLWCQDTVRVMTYNLLNYTVSDTSRDASFRTVISTVLPDLLVVQEMTSSAAGGQFHQKVLERVAPGRYAAGQFIDGPDTDNLIFYSPSQFQFVTNVPIKTALRDINEFTLVHIATAETLRVYSVHLKASSEASNAQQRAAEVDSLRKRTKTLPVNSRFLVLGDFNIYSSNELAYQKLLNDAPEDDGHVLDPISMSGTWNQAQYAPRHTQSTRVRLFGGGSTGGLDDRFDMILYSRALSEGGGVRFLPGSYVVVGNDGNHYNDSINRIPNTAVSQQVAQALHDASDHLPVYADFVFGESGMPVQLTSFTATANRLDAVLSWETATEVSNYGFDVERRGIGGTVGGEGEWVRVGFVQGAGTSTSPREYTFADRHLSPGRYAYRIKQIDSDGSFAYYSATEIEIGAAPEVFALEPNYPNPFNPETTLEFTLPADGRAVLKVYNTLGQEVAVLFNEEASGGRIYRARFDGSSFPSGVYYAMLTHGGQRQVQKLLLMK